MIEKITTKLAENPFESGKVDAIGLPKAVGTSFGILFIIIGLLLFAFIKKAQQKAEDYKKRQLEQYNKNHPRQREATDYSKTGLYLPWGEKIKLHAPVMMGVLLIFVGIAWIVGNTLTTL